jgi:hypothetical protein
MACATPVERKIEKQVTTAMSWPVLFCNTLSVLAK